MEFLRNKTVVSSIILVIIAYFSYSLFLKGNGSAPTEEERRIGEDLIQISLDLSQASFSQDLFSKPTYRLLTDFNTPLPVIPVGRPNPFDIIGRD